MLHILFVIIKILTKFNHQADASFKSLMCSADLEMRLGLNKDICIYALKDNWPLRVQNLHCKWL